MRQEENSLFLAFGDLPLHPLTVHFAVALLPLIAIGLVIALFSSKIRPKLLLPLTIASGLMIPVTFIAKESGEALAYVVGNPSTHEELGELLVPASIGLFAISALATFAHRRSWKPLVFRTIATLAALVAVGVGGLTVAVGHSGAEATWAGKLDSNATAVVDPTVEPDPSVTGTMLLTAAEDAKHSTASDCWSVVDGNVFDLTSYVKNHPGGQSVIEAICGNDGTFGFSNQHGTQSKPNQTLDSFLLGPLGSATAAQEPQASATQAPTSGEIAGADVAKHNSSTDCWTAIESIVYDLTSYVRDHPGGAQNITALCGLDATNVFASQHGFNGAPANVLSSFAIGTLSSTQGLSPVQGLTYGEGEDDD